MDDDNEELIFTEDNAAHVVEVDQQLEERLERLATSLEQFNKMDDNQKLLSWVTLWIRPDHPTSQWWIQNTGLGSADEVITTFLEDDTVNTWAGLQAEMINKSTTFLGAWYSRADEQTLKIHWRNMNGDQRWKAAWLHENIAGNQDVATWAAQVAPTTNKDSFYRS